MQTNNRTFLMLVPFRCESFENTCGRTKPNLLEAKECSKTNGCGLDDTGSNSDEGVDILVIASRSVLATIELLIHFLREVGALCKVRGTWILISTKVCRRD